MSRCNRSSSPGLEEYNGCLLHYFPLPSFETKRYRITVYYYFGVKVTGAKAMYKGTGTINGQGNYGFMISAVDEKLTPSTDVDLFRIKIWARDNGDVVIYDNMIGVDDDADPTTAIDGGSIIIHN